MNKADLLVAPCDYKAAKFAVMRWHYSRAMPTSPLVSFGAWEEGKFVGAVIFGRGSNNNMLAPYGVTPDEGAELVRVALGEHHSFTSRIVTLAVSSIKRTQKGLRLLVSYADPNVGHVGGLYQAMNWVYAGQTATSWYYVDSSGRKLHKRMASATGVSRQYGKLCIVPRFDECERRELQGKHRYLYPLDRAMRRQIEPLAQPYPKKHANEAT